MGTCAPEGTHVSLNPLSPSHHRPGEGVGACAVLRCPIRQQLDTKQVVCLGGAATRPCHPHQHLGKWRPPVATVTYIVLVVLATWIDTRATHRQKDPSDLYGLGSATLIDWTTNFLIWAVVIGLAFLIVGRTM